MKLESAKYLWDIRRAAGLLVEFTRGKTFADYEDDVMLRSAVERQFTIIGEAMNGLARIDEPTAGRITEYQGIISFRNALIHGYATVDNQEVWDVIDADIPTLIREVDGLLAEYGNE